MSSGTQKSYLPKEWSDDQRMRFMFSDFRNRDINPTGWDSKFNFWKAAIGDWCTAAGQTQFSTSDVRDAFIRNGQTVRCLDTVTGQMIKQGQLMTLEAFRKHTADQGWIGWSWDLLVQKPLGYTWSLIGSSFFAPKEQQAAQNFVNFELIKEKANQILQRHIAAVEEGKADATVSLEALAKQCQDICRTRGDLELCLALLRKDRHLTVHEEQHQKIVKFAVSGKPAKEIAQLSPAEKSLVQLRNMQGKLEQQIRLNEEEVERYQDEARKHVRDRSKNLARVALKKKRQSEALIVKKAKTLENIELLMNSLQDVDTQKAVLNALQAGSNAFKMTSEGFDLDKVDETMAQVQETLDMQQDMEQALGQPIREDNDADELENELADILAGGEGVESDVEEEEEETPSDAQTVSPTTALVQRLQKLREVEEPTLPEPPSHSPTATRDRVRMQ